MVECIAGFVQPLTFGPHLPDEVRDVIGRALQIEPSKRYPHAGAMAYDLRGIALRLGVADGRVFLRTALENEVGQERSDATLEFPVSASPFFEERPRGPGGTTRG